MSTTLQEPAGQGVESFSGDSHFVAGPHVRTASNEDGLILLDLRTGRYSAFNPVGALVWSKIEEGCSAAEIVRKLQEVFAEAPSEQVRLDVETLLKTLAGARLIEAAGDTSPRASSPRLEPAGAAAGETVSEPAANVVKDAFWWLVAFLVLVYMDLLLRVFRFPRLYTLIRDRRPASRQASPATLRRISRAVDRAAGWYFKQAWCLQRSAVCVYLLRRVGFAARLVLGVRVLPFEAHAWAELGGRVINDRQDFVERFQVLDRI